MIVEYQRPNTLDEALQWLGRKTPATYPLGGGTLLSHKNDVDFAVVDLQNLGLNLLKLEGGCLRVGAAATLQEMIDFQQMHPSLRKAVQHESSRNIRQMATLAGTIVSGGGRSVLLTALLALDAKLVWMPGAVEITLKEYFKQRDLWKAGQLMTEVNFASQTILEMEWVARSPDDLPILCMAACRLPDKEVRLTLGGFGKAPTLVKCGLALDDINQGITAACATAEDEWASAEYRAAVAVEMAQRLIMKLSATKEA